MNAYLAYKANRAYVLSLSARPVSNSRHPQARLLQLHMERRRLGLLRLFGEAYPLSCPSDCTHPRLSSPAFIPNALEPLKLLSRAYCR